MKKIIIGTLLCIAALTILSSCSKTAADTSQPATSSSSVKSDETIFTGKLVEAGVEQEDGSIRLSLQDIVAVNDPEKMLSSFSSGVILNAQTDQFAKDFSAESYAAGVVVQFSLVETPIMTMSLPPQIPGNSIKTVEIP